MKKKLLYELKIEVPDIIPPTVNSLYGYNPKIKRRYKEKHAYEFEKEFISYLNLFYSIKKKEFNKKISNKEVFLNVDYQLFCKYDRIYTKKNKIKKFDISNRTKVLEDALFKWIGLDDKYCFKYSHEKISHDFDKIVINIFFYEM